MSSGCASLLSGHNGMKTLLPLKKAGVMEFVLIFQIRMSVTNVCE
jgi:hypothetical protein